MDMAETKIGKTNSKLIPKVMPPMFCGDFGCPHEMLVYC